MTREEAIEKIEKYQCKRVGTVSESELEEALNMAIEALAEPKWIPVTERLPEVSNKRMLVSGSVNLGRMEHISTDIARYTDRGWILEGNNEPKECETITAWMPLPEPYEGSDTE